MKNAPISQPLQAGSQSLTQACLPAAFMGEDPVPTRNACPQARSAYVTLEEDLGGDVTGNGISKLVFTILSAVAENERDRRSSPEP